MLLLSDVKSQRQFLQIHTSSLDQQWADALKARADHLLRENVQSCLETAELLYYMTDLTGSPLYRALGLLAEANGRSVGGLGEYQRALDLYDEAASLYQTHGRVAEYAKAQVGKVWSLACLGQYEEALTLGERCCQILEEEGELLALGKLVMNLAAIHGRRGEPEAKVLTLFDRARKIFVDLGETGQIFLIMTDQNRALILRHLGRFEESIQASKFVWKKLTEIGHKTEAAKAHHTLAMTYLVLGRYTEALDLLNRAQAVFMEDGRPYDGIIVELNIIDCLLQLRRFTDALAKIHEVRELFTRFGTRFEVAQATLNEAIAYTGLYQYPDALQRLAEARQLFEQEQNRVWMAATDLERAAILFHQGEFESCLETALTCSAIFDSQSLPIEKAHALLTAARAALALQRFNLTYQWAAEILNLGESNDLPFLIYQGHYLLGSLAISQGDRQEARVALDRAIQELERLRGRLMVEFRSNFLEDKGAIYEDMVHLCLEMDQPLQGLEYAERAKSRALVDLLAYRLDLSFQPHDASDRPLVEELLHLRSQRDLLYRRREGNEEIRTRGYIASLGEPQQEQQEILTLEKKITSLWQRLLIRKADYAREAALWQVRTESVQTYLTPDTLLLEYFIVHGDLVVFLVTNESVEAYRLSVQTDQIQGQLRLLWLNLKMVPKSNLKQMPSLIANVQRILKQLYQHLLAPIEDTLRQFSKLVIVPHGPLHYLPFHALYNGTKYLIEEHTISYLPSASVLRYCREAKVGGGTDLVLGHSQGGILPYTVQEAKAVAAMLGCNPLLEAEVTPASLRELASNCRILHLATHGEFRADEPLFSGLILEGGAVTTLDIFNLQLNASLVTLSACQTGRNVVGGGDELLGLMRAFFAAGAASLVLSLWVVEDRSTAQLMEIFYQKLTQGMDKAGALRNTQLQMLQGNSNGLYAHPYFWAPFFLVGDAGALASNIPSCDYC